MGVKEAVGVRTREALALFGDRTSFEAAVRALMAAGFERTDLSVLASHESLDAAGGKPKPWRDVLAALIGEVKYAPPLVASGAIWLAGGPLAATLAALVGAAVGGIAIKELIDEVVSSPHTEDFARSLEAGGVILWVRVADAEREARALDVLRRHGGTNVHIHESSHHEP